jgi:hypothetical protein
MFAKSEEVTKEESMLPGDVSQTLMMGGSIDHIFSIAVASLGGVIWVRLGYEDVFVLGAIIACMNLFSAVNARWARAQPAWTSPLSRTRDW